MTNQLEQWLLGNSIHDTDRDECCPDFSCCNKKMQSSKETRERFVKAVKSGDDRIKNEMLGMWLGEAMATLGKKVYVAGLEIPESEQ